MGSPRDRLTRLTRRARRAVLRRRRPLAALFVALSLASTTHAATDPPPPRTPVLVAAHDLASGTVLGPDDLTEVDFAAGSVPDRLATQPVGRVLASPLRSGEVVSDVRLVGPALTDGYPGLTAVPVRLPDADVVDLLRVGDRVDLVAADPRGTGADPVALDVPVLAIPRAGTDVGASGLAGRLVVVGVPGGSVPRLAAAAVGSFLSVAFAR